MTEHRYSLQLYTLRDSIKTDLAETLRRVAAMGFDNVELWQFEQYRDEYSRTLAETGLRPLSAHAMLVRQDARAALRTAAELGVGTLIDPRIDAARWATRADIEAAAAELNAVAELARDEGITIGYHNHDHEVRGDFDGRTGLEVFADALDDDVVLEVDMYWAEVGGVSAAELVSRLGDRVAFLHAKDGPYSKAVSEQQPLGKGAMPVVDVLKAAPDAVRVVEFDAYDGDIFAGVEESLRYLVEVDR
ncbi:sugar phosphate isomerase/epimerase [Streptomyces sp. Li-HN-5-11]|uniref:sugar phosphate isomerase/epimerase family protein n=1 Tax=Streptomyces sp. Li-HN-5-11 TaxID=3075432 RepID=UPI0028B00BB3|nr:sugar phosphate isomerase/epimerase [Streptomyces sp. Li-HN-5-11]WNM31968.1 sugar phosphate isomerase/epimerase [Streptomyces sp. Li-HN-5-11]